MAGEFQYTAFCKPVDYNKNPIPKEHEDKPGLGFDLGLGEDEKEQGV
ncbi:hypothetical protein [Pseudoalteromonas luteoviolacea]|nr:hypothetical protein [Pseudoalteromonas luteoviolacea]MBQ4837363.1 hypothetical protein [Pseudoalteromonas luteoviolacea]